MDKIFSWFLTGYDKECLEIRKKAKILLTTNIILTCLLLMLALVMLITGAVFVAFVLFGVGSLCALTMLVIRGGKYRAAVNIFFYLSVISVFFAIKFDQYVNVYETYVIGTLGSFLLIIISLTGYNRRQPLIMAGLLIVSILVLYFWDILPAEKWTVTILHIQNLVTCSLMFICCGIYGSITISLQKELVAEAESESEKNKNRFVELDGTVRSAQDKSLDIGNRLSISTSQAMKAVTQLRETMALIKKEVSELSGSVQISSEANRKISAAAGQVKNSMENYKQSVEKVSASIEGIVTSINGISNNTKDKKGELDQLVSISAEGKDKMLVSRQSIDKVSSSSDDILKMIGVISEVANSTNMLALNAAIEASHAGEAGKGFAVVASEIRKLSSETNRSSKMIIENVKSSIGDIRNSASIIGELQQVFEQINIEIRTVAELLQNIIWDVSHVSGDTKEIVQVLESIDKVSGSVNQSVEHVSRMIENSTKGIEGVTVQTGKILSDIESMVKAFEVLAKESENADRVGRENIDNISRLYDKIRDIR